MRCAVRRAGQDSAGKWKDEFAKDLLRRPLEVGFPNGGRRGEEVGQRLFLACWKWTLDGHEEGQRWGGKVGKE